MMQILSEHIHPQVLFFLLEHLLLTWFGSTGLLNLNIRYGVEILVISNLTLTGCLVCENTKKQIKRTGTHCQPLPEDDCCLPSSQALAICEKVIQMFYI